MKRNGRTHVHCLIEIEAVITDDPRDVGDCLLKHLVLNFFFSRTFSHNMLMSNYTGYHKGRRHHN